MQRASAAADIAATTAIVTFLGMNLNEWETIVNIVAGVFAILAGAAATWYHVRRAKQINNGE